MNANSSSRSRNRTAVAWRCLLLLVAILAAFYASGPSPVRAQGAGSHASVLIPPASGGNPVVSTANSTSSARLLNISTRLGVQKDDNALIGGFIITGNDPKRVIIRGLGPSLAQYFEGTLVNPTLELRQGDTLLALNDNWQDTQADEIQATGIPPTETAESAIVMSLAPGAYTAVLRGKDNTTGIGLVEVYDLDQAANSQLANISTRGFVGSGDSPMIGGVIVGPSDAGSTYIVVRALGPSLASRNINNPLQDPTLDVVDANGTSIRLNDNWRDSQAADIEGVGLQPTDNREATLIVALAPGNYTAIVRGSSDTTGVGLVEVYNVGSSLDMPLPVPDPISQAPQPPNSGIPSFDDETSFLYKGNNPIQRGVAPGTIVPSAGAVIRGTVRNLDDQPLAGVRVTVHAHPEYGYTLSRADGQYDLAVNGGLTEHLSYELSGYFTVQREVQVLQQAFSKAPDVILITADPVATTIAFGADAPTQMAGSSTRTDAAGSRSATMFFPAGTSAALVFKNGRRTSVDQLTFRPTEYTVGPKGPTAMPGPLPGASQYTYCVNMASEEAIAAGAKETFFDHDVFGYVENFLGFPVGAIIPNGYYDQDKAAWVPSANGLIIQLLSVSNGIARLDLNGDGTAESDADLAAVGINNEERQLLATRFPVGATFMRIPLNQQGPNDLVPTVAAQSSGRPLVSTDNGGGSSAIKRAGGGGGGMPSDMDWNCPPDLGPNDPPPGPPTGPLDPEPCPDCCSDIQCVGGQINLASQVFQEQLPLAGTDFSLHYASDRVPGYLANATLDIPLTGDTTPGGLLRTYFEVDVAGQTSSQTFDPGPNVAGRFQWDGRDVYHPQGRAFSSSSLARVTLQYRFPLYYAGKMILRQNVKLPPIFGLPGTMASRIGHSGAEAAVQTQFDKVLTLPDHRRVGLGGWSVTPHHFYDPIGKILYRGDGRQVRAAAKGRLEVVYGGFPVGLDVRGNPIAVNAKGETYFGGNYGARDLYKVAPDGRLLPVTASRSSGKPQISVRSHELDGKLAADVTLDEGPADIRSGPDGSIYLSYSISIWKLDKDDRFHLVLCGSSDAQINAFAPDGTSSHEAYCKVYPKIAIAKDGSVYFNDFTYSDTDGRAVYMIRKVAPDERIYTIAGLGGQPKAIDAYTRGDQYGDLDLGTPALTARFREPRSLAVGPDDSVYYASGNFGLNRIKPNGILERVVFDGPQTDAGRPGAPSDEGKPGVDAGGHDFSRTAYINFVNVAPDGSVYFWSYGAYSPRSLWRIGSNGLLERVAGGYFGDLNPDHAPRPNETGNPLQVAIDYETTGLALGPNGSLYLATANGNGSTIRQITPILPGFNGAELKIASEDGSEFYIFDGNGRHLRTLDPLLNFTKYAFSYDARGFLTTIRDRDGLITSVERDSSGNATAVVGPYGTKTQLGLDGNGFLASVTAPDKSQTQITNSQSGLVQSITGPQQDTEKFAYDDMGRLIRGDQPTGGFTTISRSGPSRDATLVATTAEGVTETRAVGFTPTGGTQVKRTFAGQTPEISTNEVDGSTTLDHSPLAIERLYQSPDPRLSFGGQASYPSLIKLTVPNGPEAKITANEQATLSNPDDPTSITNFVSTVSLNGNPFTTTYDVASRTHIELSPDLRKSVAQLNAAGRIVQTQAGNLSATNFRYDDLGRLTGISAGTNGSQRSAEFGYDAGGFVNFGHAPDGEETHLANDVLGRPISIQLPGDRRVGLTYAADGRTQSVTPPDRPAYAFDFDPQTGTSIYRRPPIAGVDNITVVERTLDQQIRSTKLPGNRTVNLSYDASGRVAKLMDSFGDSFSYSYNSGGQVSTFAQPDGRAVAFAYTGVQVSKTTWSGEMTGSITRTFNNDFLVSSERLNNGDAVLFTYNADDLPTGVGGLNITWRSDIALPASAAIGAVSSSFEYSEFGDLLHASHTSGGSGLLEITDTVDQAGRTVSDTTTVAGGAPAVTAYGYNAAGFLASVSRNGVPVSSYSYDSNGNITNATTSAGTTSYTFDAQDRLITAGATIFTYTDAGELRTKNGPGGTTTYTYDELGQLRRVSLADGRLIEYSLGTATARVTKKINGTSVHSFLRDEAGTIVAELDANNAPVSRFVYVPGFDAPSQIIRGSETFRILADILGSVRLVVNVQSGAIVQRLDYDEWGNVTLDSNPGFQPFGFAGGIYDPDTKLVRFGARDYDPSIRRWTAPDPIDFFGGTTNLYAYVDNNPINSIDLTGTEPCHKGGETKGHGHGGHEANEVHGHIIPKAVLFYKSAEKLHEVGAPRLARLLETLDIIEATDLAGRAIGATTQELTGHQLLQNVKGVDATGPNSSRNQYRGPSFGDFREFLNFLGHPPSCPTK